MPRIPATQSAGRRDNIQLPLAAGQTFKVGAFVLLSGVPDVVECGADPAVIYGISEDAAGKNPVDPLKVIVGRATEVARWWIQCSADPVAANLGILYGIAKDADGIWYCDFTDVVNTRVYVHQVDVDTKRVEISVKEANRQVAP